MRSCRYHQTCCHLVSAQVGGRASLNGRTTQMRSSRPPMKLQRRVRGWNPVTSQDGPSTVGHQRQRTSWSLGGESMRKWYWDGSIIGRDSRCRGRRTDDNGRYLAFGNTSYTTRPAESPSLVPPWQSPKLRCIDSEDESCRHYYRVIVCTIFRQGSAYSGSMVFGRTSQDSNSSAAFVS